MCSEELQQKLMPVREKFKEIEDKKIEEATKVLVYAVYRYGVTIVRVVSKSSCIKI